ncbi:hypothetical protein Abiwalacus_07010 [Akkermansia biwaensis]|uniref:Uncharacterized protein n=1 Tax=Akkermansia biwaensis TaxID=2946555 RepID=A0ABN6QIW7_9BACT|nr:hypothetical protein Abiwalacus_07010 [Akkermansia biwaensis]
MEYPPSYKIGYRPRPHGNFGRTYDNPEQAEKSALMSIPKTGASIELQKLNMFVALWHHGKKCCAEQNKPLNVNYI